MSAISKDLFYDRVSSVVDCNLVHPWTSSCFSGNGRLMLCSLIGCSKFFLPIYLVQAALSGREVDVLGVVRSYLRSIVYGICFVSSFIAANCLLRKSFGRFHYYNVGFTSGFLSGLSIFIESKTNMFTTTLLFFNLVIEAAINNLEWVGFFNRTQLKDTLAFMTCSSLLVYLFKTQKQKPYNNLWFYPPARPKMQENEEKQKSCQHEKKCGNYAFEGFLKYFGAGYAVEIIKFLLGSSHLFFKRPQMLPKVLINKDNFKFGLVTGGYVAIYRVVTCLLLRFNREDRTSHHVLAAFLSGSTYFIKPNIQFGITTVTTIFQLLLQRAQSKLKISATYNGVLFAVFNALLFHNRMMLEDTCPKYTKNMIKVCTNGLGDQIINLLISLVRASG